MSSKSVDLLYPKKLELDTEIKPFDCEDKELNDFLLNDAKNYLAQMFAVTYIIENNAETVAYFSLLNDNIRRITDRADEKTPLWNKVNRKMPFVKNKGSYPAVKIGRLAVSKKYARNGFGRLMIDVVKQMYRETNQKSGCRFISVDAYSTALDFYERNGFKFITEKDEGKSARIMYFDLKSIQ
jgi:GNAT superfamily N-acetyltransferase